MVTATVATTIMFAIMKWVAIAGIVIGCLITAVIVYKRLQHKYVVVIYSKRAEGKSAIRFDKGGYFKLRGGQIGAAWVFHLVHDKAYIKPPENKFIHSAGKKQLIHLRHFGADLYEAFNPVFSETAEEEYLTNLDYDESISWNLSTKDLVYKTFNLKDLWEKYGPLITAVLCLVMAIVAIYIVTNYARSSTGDLAGAIRDSVSWIQSIVDKLPQNTQSPAP